MTEPNPSPTFVPSTDTNTETDTPSNSGNLSIREAMADPSSEPTDSASPVVAKRGGFNLGKVLGKVASAAGTVGSVAGQAKGAIADTVTGAVAAVGTAASQTGGAIVNTVTGTADVISQGAIKVTDTVTSVAGQTIDLLRNYPYLQPLTKPLKLDWLLPLIDQVDVVKAEERVKQLQRQYPQDMAAAIAHRIMVEKAIYVGGSGFASSFMPGFATALLAVDLAATMVLQAEMVYQIAAAYGLNLQDPSRKGEVVAIFALSFGGNAAIKAGLGFLRNAPVAGAVIGASSNAVMLYALGHAACQFYQLKVQPCLPAAVVNPVDAGAVEASWLTIQTDSEAYLQANADQQVILDQIVVHLVLASYPNQSIPDLLPHLRSLNLQPATLEQLTTTHPLLPPLSELLAHLNPELGLSLLAQCQAIAQMDSVVTAAEQQIIDQLAQTLSPIFSTSSQETLPTCR